VQQRVTYEKLHHMFGDSYQSLHWDSQDGQVARFAALLGATGLSASDSPSVEYPSSSVTLLDLGCGLGHLAQFLHQHPSACKRPIELVGIDIVQQFVNTAAVAHPQHEFVWYVCAYVSTMVMQPFNDVLS
jgi:2-polyprenyl-3-methyl-5-hydroxy-6-metoxy-1,4-benzoquinol methylase